MSEITTQPNTSIKRKIKITVDSVKGQNYVTKSYPDQRMNKSLNPVDLYTVPSYKMYVEGVDNEGNKSRTEFEVLRFGVYLNTIPTTDYPSKSKNPIVVGMNTNQTYPVKEYKDYTVHSALSLQKGAWVIKKGYYIHAGPQNVREVFATIGCIEVCGASKFNQFKTLLLELSGLNESPYEYNFFKVAAACDITCEIKKAPVPYLKKIN